jgi:Zn-dependent protease
MDPTSLHPVQKLVVWALPVLFAITLHEVAHGWVANKLGDPTARMLGRLSLNPLKHIDPIGTVVVPALMLLMGGFLFGWAKPVPVTPRNFKDPRKHMALVAAAGPVSNLVMAVGWAALLKVAAMNQEQLGWASEPLALMGLAGISINLALAVLNLLPIPPLDGGRIVDNLLPPRLSATYSQLEPLGMWIILALALFGLLWTIMGPPFMLLRGLLLAAFGFGG